MSSLKLRLSLLTVLAVLGLSACGQGPTDWDPPVPTPNSTSEASPRINAPRGVPEHLAVPAEAIPETAAGARAFLTYYWGTAGHHAMTTGELAPLRAVTQNTCHTCKVSMEWIGLTYATRAELKIKEFTVSDFGPLNDTERAGEYRMRATVRTGEMRLVPQRDTPRIFEASEHRVDHILVRTSRGWAIADWSLAGD
ncbi:DUF6318 family protein [Nocardioides limicola]|uniref:DUF6318 family protein n=1 Tax=Nocardioides limicola TaxID=2803368 RepID=UPI00193BCFED|nr:DUF6318 family protein [Nocardioides sp. DJM-14]